MRYLLLFLVVAGCTRSIPCSSDAECTDPPRVGACLPSPSSSAKWCGFPSSDCPSARRWDTSAGDGLAGSCVAGTAPDMAVERDLAAADLTLPDLAQVDAAPDLSLPDLAHVPIWTAQKSNTPSDLFGVWGSFPLDVYAVGAAGTILHTVDHGKTWIPQPSNVGVALFGVWGSGPNDVFAVGNNGIVLHSTGDGTWSLPQTTNTNAGLIGVWGSGQQVVFAAGSGGVLIRSSDGGKNWFLSGTGITNDNLNSVWGSGPGDIYVCGQSGKIWHSVNGTNWVAEQSATAGILFHGFSFAPGDVYGVGVDLVHSTGGGMWKKQGSAAVLAYGVWGSGPTDTYSVGGGGEILHTDGGGMWQAQVSGTANDLFSAWGFNRDDVYAVGGNGEIRHLE